jgi:predicted GIY-YIG superfamily endonuclease
LEEPKPSTQSLIGAIMYYVYVLYNQEKELMYIGYTNDLKRRYKERIKNSINPVKD